MKTPGEYAFDYIFKTKPRIPSEQPESYTGDNWLMGPNFEDYCRHRTEDMQAIRAYPFESHEIRSTDGLLLKGYLYRSPENVWNGLTAVLVHGYRSDGFKGNAGYAMHYIEKGYHVFFPDLRACGASEGNVITFGIRETEDMLLWLEYLGGLLPGSRFVLHGASMGGATVCNLSGEELPVPVVAIIADCAFRDIKLQLAYMIRITAHIPAEPALSITERRFRLETGCTLEDRIPLNAVSRTRIPMLFIHGVEDRYVPEENSRILYRACAAEQKQLLLIPGAGHSAARYGDTKKYYETLFAFVDEAAKR